MSKIDEALEALNYLEGITNRSMKGHPHNFERDFSAIRAALEQRWVPAAPKTTMKVIIDPNKMKGAYEGKAGAVETYNSAGSLIYKRGATDVEVLLECAVQRIEAALEQRRVPEGYTLIWKEGVPHLIPF